MDQTVAGNDTDTDRPWWTVGPLWLVRRFGLVGGVLVVVGPLLQWFAYRPDYRTRPRVGEPWPKYVLGVDGQAGLAALVVGLVIVGLSLGQHRSALGTVALGLASGVVLTVTVPAILDPTTMTAVMGVADSTPVEHYKAGVGLYVTALGGVTTAVAALVLGQAHRVPE